jgi:hypothetical protein
VLAGYRGVVVRWFAVTVIGSAIVVVLSTINGKFSTTSIINPYSAIISAPGLPSFTPGITELSRDFYIGVTCTSDIAVSAFPVM